VEDDFLQLGGHSLMAAQLAARLRALFDTEIPVRLLFDGGTVAELAARIEEHVLGEVELS
jgi:acyl carrier protein